MDLLINGESPGPILPSRSASKTAAACVRTLPIFLSLLREAWAFRVVTSVDIFFKAHTADGRLPRPRPTLGLRHSSHALAGSDSIPPIAHWRARTIFVWPSVAIITMFRRLAEPSRE